jgi:glycosyltransferase involved in cell wall biosynthesis
MSFELDYSVVIPAFKKSLTISEVLVSVQKTMMLIDKPFEIILVCDGEVDDTALIANKLNIPQLSIITYKRNRGKGYALRQGSAASSAKTIIFMDADFDLSHHRLYELIEIFDKTNADMVIGSKSHPDSKIFYPKIRRLMSFCYKTLVKILFSLKINDTQTGMKVIRSSAFKEVLPTLKIDGFACDLEVIVAFNRFGFSILEGPITLTYQSNSTLRVRSTLQMLLATLHLFLNNKKIGRR